jgi:plasmid maintenance system antidote protein VapI
VSPCERRATLSDPLIGKAAMSRGTALRIDKAFGTGMDTLLRMQAWFDGHTMRMQARRIAVKRFVPAA